MKPSHTSEAISKLPSSKNVQVFNNWLFQGLIILIILILFVFFFSALANIVWKGKLYSSKA